MSNFILHFYITNILFKVTNKCNVRDLKTCEIFLTFSSSFLTKRLQYIKIFSEVPHYEQNVRI